MQSIIVFYIILIARQRSREQSPRYRCSKYSPLYPSITVHMPTITLQVGQCGNQLGNTFWSLLQRQHEQLCNGVLSREWFSQCASKDTGPVLRPRVLSIDSEAKVAQSLNSTLAPHQLHILGHGGCGNNWACGYQFGVSSVPMQASALSDCCDNEKASRVGLVLEGVRKEAEGIAGVPDFLLVGSLAGGTGSGTGSALLEALADEYPASTLAAVAVAPSQTGDSTVQSINSCLALHHLATYAHAVVLVDNQTLLDKLGQRQVPSRTASTSASGGNSRTAQLGRSSQGSATAINASEQRKACLDGVNQLASEALLGLLWPLSREDSFCGRSNLRQLAATICADPVTKFFEVCHLSQPATAWSSSVAADPWSARVRLLSAQLPKFDSYDPSKLVTTSAVTMILRGVPGTTANIPAAPRSSDMRVSFNSNSWSSRRCCWAGRDLGSTGWQESLYKGVCSSWPGFTGSTCDIHIGSSAVMVQGQPSMTAALRRSSMGSLMRAAADRSLQLSQAGAYMHWYAQYGCSRQLIEDAAHFVSDQAMAYV